MTISSGLVDSWRRSGIECCFITEPGEILLKTMEESLLGKYSHSDFTTFDDLRRSVGVEIRIYSSEKTIIVQSIDPLKLVGRFRRFHGVYRNKNAKNLADLISGFVSVLNVVVEDSGMKGWKHELLQLIVGQLSSFRRYAIGKCFNRAYIKYARVFVAKNDLFNVIYTMYKYFDNFDLIVSKSSINSSERPEKIYVFLTPYDRQYIEVTFDHEKIKSKLLDILDYGNAYATHFNYSPYNVERYIKKDLRNTVNDYTESYESTVVKERLSSMIDGLSYISLIFVLFVLFNFIFIFADWIFVSRLKILSEPVSGILIRILTLVVVSGICYYFGFVNESEHSESEHSAYSLCEDKFNINTRFVKELENVCSSICSVCPCDQILDIIYKCNSEDEFLKMVLDNIFRPIRVNLEEVLF